MANEDYSKKSNYLEDKDIEHQSMQNKFENKFNENNKKVKKKPYNYAIRNALQKVMSMTYYDSVDGVYLSVAEKAAISVAMRTIQNGSSSDLKNLADITGDRVEKTEVNVTGFKELLKETLDKEKF
jgi:hypothetical protein